MYSPNILITNYCNQSCSYCFAKKLMNDKKVDQEMSIENFKKVVRKIKKIKDINVIKLLGGEPTLHSKFEQIINISLVNFEYIQIFTNGLFSEDKALFMKKHLPRIRFTININTPNFQQNQQSRKLIINRIQNFAKSTQIALSITINPRSNIKQIIRSLGNKTIRSIKSIRIGASNPITGDKNFYSFNDFPKIGSKVCELIKKLKLINKTLAFNIDCGFVRCMFSNNQYKFLKINKINKDYWGCYFGNIDVLTNLKTIICYSLSEKTKVDLKRYSINKIENMFILNQYLYLSKYKFNDCKKCKYYGLERNKCPGPCIAFLINKNLKKTF